MAFGGPSPEHDVSIVTGLPTARALAGAGKDVVGLYWSKVGSWHQVAPTLEAADFVDGVPRGAQELRLVLGDGGGFVTTGRRERDLAVDVVVNCCHGGPGEDGTFQGALDLAGIRYTGPDVAGAALGMDKLAFAGAAGAAGLPVLDRRLITASTTDVGFEGPYIVKPRFGGSSIGIRVVVDLATALGLVASNPLLQRGAVIEPYRASLFDLNVAIRAWPDLELSAVERPLRTSGSAEILGYHDKYVGGEGMASAPRELPARLSPSMAERVRTVALAVGRLAGVRGVARIDFLSDGHELYLNEVNTIPGSLARYLWVDPPMPFVELLETMIEEAQARPTNRYSVAGADGTVLRGAGAIAAKLA